MQVIRVRHQRGVIAVLAVSVLTLCVMCVVLAVDVARILLEDRRVQRIADLAALELASRASLQDGLLQSQEALDAIARESATRNGFAPADERLLTVRQGTVMINEGFREFVPGTVTDRVADAVQVIAEHEIPTSLVANLSALLPGSDIAERFSVSGSAVAQRSMHVSFAAGTTLLTADTSNSLVAGMLAGLLGVDANLVGYQGLVNLPGVTLLELMNEMGLTVGSVDELLDLSTELTLLSVVDAIVEVVGDVSGSEDLLLLRAALASSELLGGLVLDLADLLQIHGDGGDALQPVLSTFVSVPELLNTAILFANQGNAVSASADGGLVNVDLTVIEAPVLAMGPVGCVDAQPPPCVSGWRTEARPGQLSLDVGISTSLLGLVSLDIALEIDAVEGIAGINRVLAPIDNLRELHVAGLTPLLTQDIDIDLALLPAIGSLVVLVIDSDTESSQSWSSTYSEATALWPQEDQVTLSGPAVSGVLDELNHVLSGLDVRVEGGGLLTSLLLALLNPLLTITVGSLSELTGALLDALGGVTTDLVEPLLEPLLQALGLDANTMDVSIHHVYHGPAELVL